MPLASLIELQAGARVLCILSGQPENHYLLANSGGYGFIAKLEDMASRVKAGKVLMTLDKGEQVLMPVRVYQSALINPDCRVIAASAGKRLLAFPLAEMKIMAKGRGLQLMSLAEGDTLALTEITDAAEYTAEIAGKRGGTSRERLRVADIDGKRGRKGRLVDLSGSLKGSRGTGQPENGEA